MHSLIDLSQGLTVTVDLFRAVDILLLNLMGQLGTARSILWLVADDPAGHPAFIRSHGLPSGLAEEVSDLCATRWLAAVRGTAAPIQGPGLEEALEPSAAARVREARLAVLAPIWANGATVGMVVLGARADGTDHRPLDLQVLQASLGIAGIALQNGAIHNRLLESNRQLRVANEELKHLDRLKSEFLANVNHELRTPLSVIVPALECVMEADLDVAELKAFLGSSALQARKLVVLVENLLTLSELGRDTLSLRVLERDLVPVLTAYHAERLPGVGAGLRDLALAVQAHSLPARFDELRLRQVLDALVDNAVKFTPPGSRVTLGAEALARDGVQWARVRVEDNGPGIPADELGNLFDAFRQIDGSTTRRVGGLGIGLALARDLAAQMGGRLVASSEQGRGSTFSLLLRADSR